MPLCPYTGTCGGCKWQHGHYVFQLKMKLDLLVKTFLEAHIPCPISSVIPCPEIYFYRNRMDYSFDFKGNLGLKQPGYWWSVLDLQTCFLLSEASVEVMKRVREWTQKTGLPFWGDKQIARLMFQTAKHLFLLKTIPGSTKKSMGFAIAFIRTVFFKQIVSWLKSYKIKFWNTVVT